jgi:hypothetical protein
MNLPLEKVPFYEHRGDFGNIGVFRGMAFSGIQVGFRHNPGFRPF